jgi:tetratricopeptide (TPR) repeat protein
LVAADDLYRQALMLDPNDPEILDAYSQGLANRGRLSEAMRLREQLRTLEPFVPIFNIATARIMHVSGQNEAAIAILEAIPPSGAEVGSVRNLELAQAYAAAGRYQEAADTLLAIPAEQNRVSRRSVEDAARLLRNAPAKVPSPGTLPAFLDEMNFVYTHIGALDRVLERSERAVQVNDRPTLHAEFWSREYAPLRKTERFKALMRNAGLVDYWRARGWPDLCRPAGADDFVCD